MPCWLEAVDTEGCLAITGIQGVDGHTTRHQLTDPLAKTVRLQARNTGVVWDTVVTVFLFQGTT